MGVQPQESLPNEIGARYEVAAWEDLMLFLSRSRAEQLEKGDLRCLIGSQMVLPAIDHHDGLTDPRYEVDIIGHRQRGLRSEAAIVEHPNLDPGFERQHHRAHTSTPAVAEECHLITVDLGP